MMMSDISAQASQTLAFKSVSQLCDIEYSIVGDGGYVVTLLALIQSTHGNLPKRIYVNQFSQDLPAELQVLEEALANTQEAVLVLGTSLFQLEMLIRITKIACGDPLFVDVLAAKGNEETLGYYQTQVPKERPYLIFIAVNPHDNIQHYLANFFSRLDECKIDVVIRHPLQHIADQVLLSASGVLIWNGSMSIHQPILRKIKNLNIEITFVECGFFPQSEYFYFDKVGVNDQSQLQMDDLHWVGDEHKNALEIVRRAFYLDASPYPDSDYIFVPLQVPNDSNILNNSRFTSGMQEFIDFIEQKYADQKIIFKAHPKDRMKSHYRLKHGVFSEADSRSLIMGAKLVHGINSSVLYEAALCKTPVEIEGECLLKKHIKQIDKLLAAMHYRQFNVLATSFNPAKLQQFSFIEPALLEQKNVNGKTLKTTRALNAPESEKLE